MRRSRSAAGWLALAPPLSLAVLELGHPRGAGANPQALQPIAEWWLALHLMQLPLFLLVAWTLAELARQAGGTAATVSRAGLLVFAVSTTVLDSVAGIAAGLLARAAAQLPADQRAVADQQLQTLLSGPLIGTRLSAVDLLVANSWLIGLVALVGALGWTAAPHVPRVLLLLAGLSLWYGGHATPFGPIAFGCVFVSLWLLGAAHPAPQQVARRLTQHCVRNNEVHADVRQMA